MPECPYDDNSIEAWLGSFHAALALMLDEPVLGVWPFDFHEGSRDGVPIVLAVTTTHVRAYARAADGQLDAARVLLACERRSIGVAVEDDGRRLAVCLTVGDGARTELRTTRHDGVDSFVRRLTHRVAP